MALNGSFISNTGVNLNVYVEWSASQNIAGNFSYVTLKMYIYTYTLSSGAKTATLDTSASDPQSLSCPAINDTSASMTYWLMGEKTFVVYHNADGTMPSLGLSAYYPFTGTYGGHNFAGEGITAATTVALDTIPRGSIIGTPTLGTLENSFSVPTTKYTGYDRLDILYGDTLIKRIDNYVSGAAITFTETELQSLYTAMGAASGTLTFQLKTYTSTAYTTQIGSTSSTTKVGTFAINSTLGTSVFVYDSLENGFSVPVTKKCSWYYDVLKLYVNNTLIRTINNYVSNANVDLTDSEILAAYNALKGTTPEMTPTVALKIDTYLASNLTHKVGAQASITDTITTLGSIRMKIGGVWKNCLPYIKVNGIWQKCLSYIKVSGTWERGI